MSIFLDENDVNKLTGKKRPGNQIVELRRMRIPFYINASGRPAVTRTAVEGYVNKEDNLETSWTPAVLKHGAQTNR